MGVSGLVSEMLLLRELMIVFSGNELSIGIILANWLIIEAFGCFVIGKKAEDVKNKIETFVGLTVLFSISLIIEVYLTRILKRVLGVSVGESLGFLPIMYSSFLILLPVSAFHGALFTFSCKMYSMFFNQDASSAGKVYAYEILGMILSGIVWMYLLIPYLHAFQISAVVAMLNFIVCIILLIPYFKNGRKQKLIMGISVLFLFLFGYLIFGGGANKLHWLSIKTQWKGQHIVHYQNSIHGNICVTKSGGQYSFFLDGIPTLMTPIPDISFVEGFVNIPLLSHPDPKKLLILSGGAGGVINEVLKHPSVKVIEYAELDPLLLSLIRKFPTSLTEYELTNSRVKVKHIDGRLFIKLTRNKYDLILVGLSNPADLQTNRFFTKEFFSLVKKRLNKDGVLVMSLPGSLTYLNDELKNLNSCILNTIKTVFSYVRIIPREDTNLFLSSDYKEITLIDEIHLANRLNERNLKANLTVPRHIVSMLHPRWQDWFYEFIEGGSKKINLDFKPIGVFYSISYWNVLFAPYLCGLLRLFVKINLRMFFLMFIVFVALFFLIRSIWSSNKRLFGAGTALPLCIATTGFAGMIFDLALIFTFQSIYGYAFYWLGILVTSFMAGSMTGSMVITSLLSRIKNDLKLFIKTELSIICFSLALPFIFLLTQHYLDIPTAFFFLKALFLVLSFVGGLLIGVQFPLSNKIYLKNSTNLSRTAGFLYSCDLLGGWMGGIVGGVFLLPVLGLLGTCIVVALLKLSSLIIVTVWSQVPLLHS